MAEQGAFSRSHLTRLLPWLVAAATFLAFISALVRSGGGVRARGPEELAAAFGKFLVDPEFSRKSGEKARETLAGLQGGIERTLRHLAPCIDL